MKGCLTCRKRKAKCGNYCFMSQSNLYSCSIVDENWPVCVRCQRLQRPCSWSDLPLTSSLDRASSLQLTPSIDERNPPHPLKYLEPFAEIFCPFLVYPYDRDFPTVLGLEASIHSLLLLLYLGPQLRTSCIFKTCKTSLVS